jgi:thiamine-monophosphate kinase
VKLSDDSAECIAVTVDSISEEIESGLYDDPYLIGWMTVMVNISDLAAVGAKPIGLLISEIFPEDLPAEDIEKIQNGISDAVKACGTFILGGDTNTGKNIVMTGCALGKSADNKYLKRTGCQPGDFLYSTNFLGRGNAYAISKLLNKKSEYISYLPVARIKEESVIHNFASCCMDTSDGFISTLDQLMRLNNLGFQIFPDWQEKVDPESIQTAEKYNIPSWLLLAGQHGEFELLFTIPEKDEAEFLLVTEKEKWLPVRFGKVIPKPEIQIDLYRRIITLNSQKIRNLPYECEGDIKLYLKKLLDYDRDLRFTNY